MFGAIIAGIRFIFITCTPPVLIIAVPVLFILWYFKKGKRGILKIITAVTTLFAIVAIAFNILFPTAFPYVDWWILGKTQAEVVEVYKEDGFSTGRSSFYDIPYPLWSGYYCIDYNEDGRAYYMETIDSTP